MKIKLKLWILILISLFCSIPSSYAQQKVKVASFVYLGSMLIEEPDSASMAAACMRYRMEQHPSEDGYAVFSSEDGTTIHFKFEDQDGHKLPIVKIQTPEKPASIKRELSQTGYTLTKEGYIKGSKFANKYTFVFIRQS